MHKVCHKDKIFNGKKIKLFIEYRKIQKLLLFKKIKITTFTENKINKLHLDIVLKLENKKKLQYLHEIDNKTIKALFKKYIMQVKKLSNS